MNAVVLKPNAHVAAPEPNHRKPCDLGEFPPVKVDCVLTTTPPAAAKASESAAEAWEEGGQIPCQLAGPPERPTARGVPDETVDFLRPDGRYCPPDWPCRHGILHAKRASSFSRKES